MPGRIQLAGGQVELVVLIKDLGRRRQALRAVGPSWTGFRLVATRRGPAGTRR